MTKDLSLRVKGDSTDANRALAAASREMDRTAANAREMGRAFDNAKRDAAQLDRQLLETKVAAAALARQFASSDTATRGSIAKQIAANRTLGAELHRIRGEIIGDTERDSHAATNAWKRATGEFEKLAKRAAKDSASVFEDGFVNGLSGLAKDPKIIAIGVGIGAALAIPIGAAIGGATIAAAGIGGAALAGLAASKADTSGRVAAAGQGLLGDLNKQLLAGGADAIEPLLAGIRQLRDATQDIHLDRIIRDSAKYIEPLAAGAGRMATYLSQGADDLVASAGPAIKVLAEELPAIGRAFKSAFDSIAGGSEGGARALQDFLRGMESFIVETGKIIGYLETAYGAVRKFGDGFEDLLQRAHDSNILLAGLVYPSQQLLDIWDAGKDSAEQYGVRLDKLAHDMTVLGDASKEAAGQVQFIDTAFSSLGQSAEGELTSKILSSMLSLDDATIGFQESLAKLDDTVKANGSSLDVFNEKTGKFNDKALANEQALLGAVRANAQLYSQNLLSGESAAQAAAEYEKNSETLRKQAIQAGYSATAVDGLIGKYGQVPAEVETVLATRGLTDALTHLGELLTDFKSLDDKTFRTKYYIDTYFRDYGGSYGGQEAARHVLPPGHRAAGGPVVKGQPYIVGDGGRPELFVPNVNGKILPRVPSPSSVTSMWGSGSGVGTTRVASLVYNGNASGLESIFLSWLHGQVRAGRIQLAVRDRTGDSLPVKVLGV